MKYYLGIDGGGTKTHAILIDENLNIKMDKIYNGTHIITYGNDNFNNVMTSILNDVNTITNNINFVFAALAGYGEFKSDNEMIEELFKKVFADIPHKILNDSVGVWAGGLLCEDGIGVIAGTGSNCAGIIGDTYQRVGGWGYIAGDEASAYWIALKTVNAYMKMYDGRLEKTVLVDIIDKEYQLNEERNLLYLIHREMNSERPKIAQIAKCCSIAAQSNCEISQQILNAAAYELTDHIRTITKKLNFNSVIPITYTGGVFNSELFKKYLTNHLNELENDFIFKDPITNAAHGSAIYAYILAGNKFTIEMRNELINNL